MPVGLKTHLENHMESVVSCLVFLLLKVPYGPSYWNPLDKNINVYPLNVQTTECLPETKFSLRVDLNHFSSLTESAGN